MEMGRVTLGSGDLARGYIETVGVRTDGIGLYESGCNFLFWYDGGANRDDDEVFENRSVNQVGFRLQTDGDDIVLECRGRAGQTWDFTSLAYKRDL